MIRHIGAPRGFLLPIILLLLLIVPLAPAKSQQIELDVASALVTHNLSGRTAIAVSLSAESRGAFAAFTTRSVGRLLEIRFGDDVLSTVRLQTSIEGGKFQIGGTVSDDNAAEIARKLLSNGAKLEVRVVDEKR
jgi:preprotein translocase subunit SecD